MRMRFAIIVLAFASALSGPVAAQNLQQQVAECTSRDVETIIRGCTALINSSRVDRENKAVAHVVRGSAYSRRGDLDSAVADFSAAISRNPRSLVAFYNRGIAYTQQENYDRAIEDFSRAISLQPDHSLSYTGRGTAYLAKGEVERAIAQFNKALELDPGNTQAATNRALAYAKSGDIGGVLRNFGTVVKVFFRSLFGRQ